VKLELSSRIAGTGAAALLIFAAGLVPANAAAKAKAPKSEKSAPAAYASSKSPTVAEPTTTASVTPAEDKPANCRTARRKLWVQDEGWIVRRVTTCF
jgi:hypothetical protein